MSSRIVGKLLDFKSKMFVGISRPIGGGYSLVDGKKCKGYANGKAVAYFDGNEWRVTNG